jgi:hypothetical protein
MGNFVPDVGNEVSDMGKFVCKMVNWPETAENRLVLKIICKIRR